VLGGESVLPPLSLLLVVLLMAMVQRSRAIAAPLP
jgi:hypothetical protein